MTEKSYVALEQTICPVCGKASDTGAVLLHRGLKKVLEHHQPTGYDLCAEHKKLEQDGYVALVEVNNKSRPQSIADADRTGNVAHVRREAWDKIFDIPVPQQGLAFVETGTIALLETKTKEAGL